MDVGSARYEPALLPPYPTIRVLSYSNCQEIHPLIFEVNFQTFSTLRGNFYRTMHFQCRGDIHVHSKKIKNTEKYDESISNHEVRKQQKHERLIENLIEVSN